MTTKDVAKMLASLEGLASTCERIIAMLAYDKNKPSDSQPSNDKGKDIPGGCAHLVPRNHRLHRRASALLRFPIDMDEDEDEDEDEDPNEDTNDEEDPVIPDTIKTLDLAVHDNDLLDLLRPHKGGQGKLNQRKNKRYSKNIIKVWQEEYQLAMKEPRLPRCRFGTRRRLNHPRDDLARHMCWFHRHNVDRRSEKYRRK